MQPALRVFIIAENDTEGGKLRRTFQEAPGFVVVGVTLPSSSAPPEAAASFDVAIIQAPQALHPAPFRGIQVPTLYLLSEENSRPKELTGKNAVLSRNASAPQIRAAAMAVAAGLHIARTNGSAAAEIETELDFVEPLTDRELRVLNLLADGLSNPQIARLLNISRNTVKFHVSSIISKLGATSRTEAVTIGVKRGLILL
jgi:two-component system, NarL family, response regulator YdfI